MSSSIDSLVPSLRPFARALVDIAARAGLGPRITSARRSHTEQARLYRRYLAGVQPYPVAPPGESAHEYGMAFDMITAAMDLADFRDLGKIWTGWGGVWGGEFNDPIHFELPGFPHQTVHTLSRKARAANFAASFLPGPAGIAAAISPPFEDAPPQAPDTSTPAGLGEWLAYQVKNLF